MEHHRLVDIIKARAKGSYTSGSSGSGSAGSIGGTSSSSGNGGGSGSTSANTSASTSRGSRASVGVVVADMMAGVGPFAVPLAMSDATNNTTASSNNNNSGGGGGKGGKQNNNNSASAASSSSSSSSSSSITVHANDLNPASYRYLVINGKNNKCRLLHHLTFYANSLQFIILTHMHSCTVMSYHITSPYRTASPYHHLTTSPHHTKPSHHTIPSHHIISSYGQVVSPLQHGRSFVHPVPGRSRHRLLRGTSTHPYSHMPHC